MKYQIICVNDVYFFKKHGSRADYETLSALYRLANDPGRVTFKADEDGTLHEAP